MNKVPFDTLEVGCKYESRCGEIWEVTGIVDDQGPLTHNANNLDDDGVSSVFTKTGKFWSSSSISSHYDLVYKVNEKTRHKVKHSVEIDVGSPLAAAKWICENNPYMKAQGKSVSDMLKSIHDSIRWLLEDVERAGTGTAGYMVRRCWEDEDSCVIEITVDPCVGNHAYYADVEDYLNQSGV